jgi:REP element-mobilizing transposase RayT
MKKSRDSGHPIRTQLDSTHYAARFGATFFITICCERGGVNQLCGKVVARVLFETARRYDAAQKWYLKVLLLMPDHLHLLVGVPGDASLSNLVRDFKRITARSQASNGSETFSITDSDTMKAKRKNFSTSAKIRYEQA